MLVFRCRWECRSGVCVCVSVCVYKSTPIFHQKHPGIHFWQEHGQVQRIFYVTLRWGHDITWVQTYEEGLFHIQKSNKPLMVIHHLEDCQYCQALKKVFAQNKKIQTMAQNNFIMLNPMHETTDKNLSPDGQYVPRIMFVDPSLTVRDDITGRYSNRLYTYEPQDLPLWIENMKKALKLTQSEL